MINVKKIQVLDLTAEIFGEFELQPGFHEALKHFLQRKIKFPYHLIFGKFFIKCEREKELVCVVNDVFGSYRIYIRNNQLLTNFPEDYCDNDEAQLELLKRKGYCQGEKTSDKNILKVPPCSAHFNGGFIEQLPEITDMSPDSYANELIETISKIDEQKIGVAFSGGADSVFLARLLLFCNKTPVLYHFITDTMDKANEEDLNQSRKVAKSLNLKLQTIRINAQDRKDYLLETGSRWRNDKSIAFSNIRCFIKKIELLGEVNLLITGQNADTFINHGITRKLNTLDIYQLIAHKLLFKKLFENNRITILSKIILLPLYLFLVDRSIRQSWKKIPTTKDDFIKSSITEQYYMPTLTDYAYDNFFDTDSPSYERWYFLNKLNNHIGGNHSVAWSDDRELMKLKTLMPFNSISYLRFSNSEYKTLQNIFYPKRKLKKVIAVMDRKYRK